MKRFAIFCFALLFAVSAGFSAENDRTCVKCFLESCQDLEPLFNGKDMTGWRVISGIEWPVEDGALVGPIKT
ncbi:MAG TPA: hypothetical protein PLZ55_19880, partial [bacterium]|nr:hypothetical protein [bacterium]